MRQTLIQRHDKKVSIVEGTGSSRGVEKMKGLAIKAVWFIAALLFSVQTQAGTYYFHNDHLGTPQVLTDDTQTVVWKGEYDPFGKVTETVSTVEQNLRFPGQYYDQERGFTTTIFGRMIPVQDGMSSQILLDFTMARVLMLMLEVIHLFIPILMVYPNLVP